MNGCKVCGKPTKKPHRVYCSYKCSNSVNSQKPVPKYPPLEVSGPTADKCRKAREMRVSGHSRVEIAKIMQCSVRIIGKYLDPDYAPKPKVEKLKVPCSACGAELLRYPKQIYKANYCSRECRSKKLEIDGKRIPKICKQCGASFYVSRSKVEQITGYGTYCSNHCRHIAQAPRPRICPVCKRAFISKSKGEHCFLECWEIDYEFDLPECLEPEIRNCEYCGKEFTVLRRDKKRYCSQSCANTANYKGGFQPAGENHWNWQGGKPKHKDKPGRWSYSVRERDGFTCQDCGATDELHGHHIFPKADFPEHRYELWNGVTLCHYCHMKAHGYELEAKKYFGRV